ncbi:cellulose binding domain-containing protein [Rhizocola hellebori]|nr:cellulose binding domain-containing protein [Rhizocola hellebori]
MAKHRRPQDDPPDPVPAEEPAAGHRARPALSIRRHAIVAAAAASLSLIGATGWALTRPDSGPGDGSPRAAAPDAMASAGGLDGFGPASPVASSGAARPSPRPSVAQPPSTPPRTEASPARSIATTVDGLQATYTMLTWQGGYQVTLVVTNQTTAPALWKLRIELPAKAMFGHSWSAELARDGAVLTFTPPKWDNGNPRPLAPGATHTFGFIALQTSGAYSLVSCAVDGVACRAVQP